MRGMQHLQAVQAMGDLRTMPLTQDFKTVIQARIERDSPRAGSFLRKGVSACFLSPWPPARRCCMTTSATICAVGALNRDVVLKIQRDACSLAPVGLEGAG